MIFDKKNNIQKQYNYIVEGEGHSIVLLHGLMGNLSNFEILKNYLVENKYKVFIPSLPLYTLPILSTSVRGVTKYIKNFLIDIVQEPTILVGNSLGGHIALLIALYYPECSKGLILTGSSGLYEKSFGKTFPKYKNYEYIKLKTQKVFYNPSTATKKIIDDVYNILNNRMKLIKIISIAKSAIQNNLINDLDKILIPVLLIWGKQDHITPPKVARDFNRYIRNTNLFWIDKCGHAPMMEKPKEFNNLVIKWLKNLHANKNC